MAAIPYHVAEAFSEGRSARAGNFVATPRELWSYNMLIAHRHVGGGITWDIDPNNPPTAHKVSRGGGKVSITTSRHIKAALSVLR